MRYAPEIAPPGAALHPDDARCSGALDGSGALVRGTQYIAVVHVAGPSNVPTLTGGAALPSQLSFGAQVSTAWTIVSIGPSSPPRPPGRTLAARVHTRHSAHTPPSQSVAAVHGKGTHHWPSWPESPRAPGGHEGGPSIASASAGDASPSAAST